jgi:Sec-independent protein secretion pathway component TatC
MTPIIKRALFAAAISFVATLLASTPEVITQVLIFVPAFILTFSLLWAAAMFSNKKSPIVNRQS